MAVGAVLLLLLSLVSGCSLMHFIRLHSGLFGAVCCFVYTAPVRVGCCVLPMLASWGLVRVLPFLCCWSAIVGRLCVLECAFLAHGAHHHTTFPGKCCGKTVSVPSRIFRCAVYSSVSSIHIRFSQPRQPPAIHHCPLCCKQHAETCTATQGTHAQLCLPSVVDLAHRTAHP